jgi:hypothetical protein
VDSTTPFDGLIVFDRLSSRVSESIGSLPTGSSPDIAVDLSANVDFAAGHISIHASAISLGVVWLRIEFCCCACEFVAALMDKDVDRIHYSE